MTQFNFGPRAPESNPPINPQYYQPSLFYITAIGLGATTTVTTSVNNNYVIGQQCRLIVPRQYGAYELNEQSGYVISILSSTELVLNISSVGYNNFSIPLGNPVCVAQILAIGDVNSGNINSNGPITPTVTVPCSFINNSPN